jgi:hypothetical protein
MHKNSAAILPLLRLKTRLLVNTVFNWKSDLSFARYENGTVSQSRAMDTMLRLLAENPALINQLRNNGSHFSAKWQSLGKACLQSSPCRTEKLNGSSKRISKTDFFSINPEDNSWCLA